MSYQVLARKYRPKSFETLVGQEHVVRALSHALEQQRLHHAYLFTGTRGVGKTTLSRILAKSFNCETGITAKPCGVCNTCTAIDAGRFVDYIEMDAASNRGVDEMASLLEQAIYAPSNARFKVYMIDEVHMLTNHAFNAMLKTLEEPPEHVKFILATTDPQKIPVTVLSRCLQFNLKQMPPGHIIGHLENILGQEKIEFETLALRLLAQGAHGSMRDALSLTDQAIAYAAGKVTLDAVQGMLGALDQSYLIRLLDALLVRNGKALLDVADEMAARSLSYKSALQDLGTLLHQIAVAQLVPDAVADDLPEREQIMRLAGEFGKEEVQLFYQIAVHGRNELALAPDEYAGFSMTLLRMLAFRPVDGDSSQAAPPRLPSPAGRSVPSSPALAPSAVSGERSAHTPAAAPAAQVANVSNRSNASLAATPDVQVAASMISAPAKEAASAAPATRISPAMAALAAARAASDKKSPATTRPATETVAVAATTPAPVPVVPSVPPIPLASAPVPALAPKLVPKAAPPARIASPAQLPPEMQSVPAGMDDMPPPWDDDILMSSSPAGMPAPIEEPSKRDMPAMQGFSVGRGKEVTAILTGTSESAAPVSPASAPFPVTTVASVTVASSLQADRTIWNAPVPELSWDGQWPTLASGLPVRGVAQQLAQQSELIHCRPDGNVFLFELRVPLSTLLSAGSVDKLQAALSEKFGRTIRVDTKIGAVEQTANAQAIAERELLQRRAEQSIQDDHFVQTLMRDFGASIITGSVRPV